MFDVERSTELVENIPEYQLAKKKAESVEVDFVQSGLVTVDSLIEEVATMPIAQRFRRDKTPHHQDINTLGASVVHPLYKDLPESEFKRVQLENDLKAIRTQLIILSSRLSATVMDMEATKLD